MNLQVAGTQRILLVESEQGLVLNTETNPVLVTVAGVSASAFSTGDSNYVYNRSSSASSWVVNHNLNKYCSVTVMNDSGDLVIGDVHYNSLNQVTITFTAAFSGKAFFN